ncbi:hypothetical protein DPSP01_014799 [Paraphaeosphaeria sporulosa]
MQKAGALYETVALHTYGFVTDTAVLLPLVALSQYGLGCTCAWPASVEANQAFGRPQNNIVRYIRPTVFPQKHAATPRRVGQSRQVSCLPVAHLYEPLTSRGGQGDRKSKRSTLVLYVRTKVPTRIVCNA